MGAFFNDAFAWLSNALHLFAQYLLELLYYMGGWYFVKAWNALTGKSQSYLQQLSSLVPGVDFDFSFVTSPMWVLLNEWVPVSYCFSLLGIYVGIAVSVYTINWMLGAIPTVS